VNLVEVLGPLRHLVTPAPVAAAENGAGAEDGEA